VTEAEWPACEDPRDLLPALLQPGSPRKQWLFACACCRGVWPMISALGRKAVEVVERYAEGGTDDEPRAAFGTFRPKRSIRRGAGGVQAAEAVGYLGMPWLYPGTYPMRPLVEAVARSTAEAQAKTAPWRDVRRRQCDLLRELLRNPEIDGPTVDPSWLARHGGAARALAESIYSDRTFGHLPILADALEEAGCDNGDLLNHLRGPGPHVRGCWAVDLLLGKE